MKSVKKTGNAVSRFFSMLLAMALFLTMMPFGVGAAFAADASDFQPVLTITGPDGTSTEYQTVQDATAAFNDIEDTTLVEGKTLKGIGVKRLFSGFDDNAVVTVQTQDNYTGTLNANGKTVGELKDLKGILAYQDGDTPFDPTVEGTKDKGYFVFYIGKDDNGNVLKDKWVNRITISNSGGGTEPDPDPVTHDVLTVVGEGLKNPLSYDTIKTLKNDETIKPLILEGISFHTLNSYGTEEDITVTGVTIENLISIAGIKDGMELESVTATADDGVSKVYTANQILNKDLQGNQAMFIWDENGKKVQKIAIGQFAETDKNKSQWCKGEYIILTVKTKQAVKPVTKPGKPVVSLVAGKKKATVKWKAVSGAAGYEVWRSTKKNKGFKKVKTVSGKTLKFVNKKLKGGKIYYYKVRAFKKDGSKNVYGDFSKVKKIKTKR